MDAGRFYWNVEKHVGPGAPNAEDDVQLVQLGFVCKANNPKAPVTPEEKVIYGAVQVGAMYTGAPNDPLTIAIKTFQQKRGGTQDGRVSPMQSSGKYEGPLTWMMVPLNNNIHDVLGSNWPFLDKHPQCKPQLTAAVTKTFTFA